MRPVALGARGVVASLGRPRVVAMRHLHSRPPDVRIALFYWISRIFGSRR
jgi:hypothetical protein